MYQELKRTCTAIVLLFGDVLVAVVVVLLKLPNNSATTTHGLFVLSPVSLASGNQDGGQSDSRGSTSTISRKNRGLLTV